MTQNPYVSPRSPCQAADAALPARDAQPAMVGWGLAIGVMLGATWGALAGGAMGAVGFCLRATADRVLAAD